MKKQSYKDTCCKFSNPLQTLVTTAIALMIFTLVDKTLSASRRVTDNQVNRFPCHKDEGSQPQPITNISRWIGSIWILSGLIIAVATSIFSMQLMERDDKHLLEFIEFLTVPCAVIISVTIIVIISYSNRAKPKNIDNKKHLFDVSLFAESPLVPLIIAILGFVLAGAYAALVGVDKSEPLVPEMLVEFFGMFAAIFLILSLFIVIMITSYIVKVTIRDQEV